MVTTRPLHDGDLDRAIELWQVGTTEGAPPVFGVADAVRCLTGGCPSVGAFVDDRLIGTVVAAIDHDRAWLVRWVVHPDHRGQGIGSRLLDELLDSGRLQKVARVTAVLPGEEAGGEAFAARGFRSRHGLRWFERRLAGQQVSRPARELGANFVGAEAWERLAGMTEEKELIERRVVLPLADPGTAAVHGVRPPRAIILFGPPGTGKTTFAKAVAGRLGWPFVELRPSVLGGGGRDEQPARLRRSFEQLDDLDQVVAFIDEVEEIAGRRAGDQRQAVTNELLKLIPAFAEGPERLLVCATNAIDLLDSALLRPGRFEYLLPIGPPDAEARRAIWGAYLAEAKGAEAIDVDALVDVSDGATPADIEFAARKAAQRSFERAVLDDDHAGITTDDLLEVWKEVGSSLTREQVRAFEDDIDRYSRT